MTKVPMVADGGELTTLRELASDVYGRERVDWPEQMPDEVKPKIDDDHEFGYLYRLNQDVGRMGRRWVRADVSILAADFEDGKRTPIPDSGFSDFEAVLDEAAARVSGEALFQKEITRAGLGPLVPFRDFNVGDVWPVLVWDLIILEVVVSRIEATSEVGAATDWRVLMGNELVSDYAAQQRANESAARAVEQSRRQARAEARREAEEARRAAEKAVSDQRTYIDGSFRTSVLSSAQTTAGTLATTAKNDAIAANAARSKELAEAFIGYGVPEDQLEYYIRDAKSRLQRNATKAAEASVADLLVILAGGNNTIEAINTSMRDHLYAINVNNRGNVSWSGNILDAYLKANTQLWNLQHRFNQTQESINDFQSQVNLQVTNAVQSEIRHRTRFGSGGYSSTPFSPSGNEFVEVYNSSANTTRARFKKRCQGFVMLMQNTTTGLLDLDGWDIDAWRGDEVKITGGYNVQVRKWFLLYQLWD